MKTGYTVAENCKNTEQVNRYSGAITQEWQKCEAGQ